MSLAAPMTNAEWQDKVINSATPTLVDFWAEWCGPCKQIAPEVDKVAEKYSGKLNVYKVDVDTEGALAGQYGVMSIPTLLVFKGGQVVEQIVGFHSADQIASKIGKHVE